MSTGMLLLHREEALEVYSLYWFRNSNYDAAAASEGGILRYLRYRYKSANTDAVAAWKVLGLLALLVQI